MQEILFFSKTFIYKILFYNIILNLIMIKEKFVRTIRKSGTSLSINILPEIIKILKLKEGDIIRVEIEKITK